MKKLALILAILLCISVLFCACSDNKADTGDNKQNGDDTYKGDTDKKDTDGNIAVLMLGGSEVDKSTFVYRFSATKSDGSNCDLSAISATVEIKNKNDAVIYTGTPEITSEGTIFKVNVPTSGFAKGNTTLGTATVTVNAGSVTKTDTYDMYKLPYDFSDVTLPEIKEGYISYGSNGDMRVTYSITAASFDEESVTYTKENISFKINISGKITARGVGHESAKTPSIELIGSGDTQQFLTVVSCKAGENDEFTGTTRITNYVPGTKITLSIK